MALSKIPISEEQCIGESLPIMNNAFLELDERTLNHNLRLNVYSNLSAGYLSKTEAEETYVPRPPTSTNGDLLVYEHNSEKWFGTSFFSLLTGSIGPGITFNPNTFKIEAAIQSAIQSAVTSAVEKFRFVPTGAIIPFPALTIPLGWVACNGQELNKTISANEDLFNVLGYAYGGSADLFRVPDLRGYFIRGWDDNRGIDPGRALGSNQEDILKSHTHSFVWGQNAGTASASTAGSTVSNFNFKADITGDHIENTGGTETRPKNVAMIHCIKL